jgi:hypothetical protein
MSRDPEALVKIINDSGYPLQLALEHAVEGIGGRASIHHLREFPWTNKRTGEAQYLDLLVQHGPIRFLISAKRRQETDWVFVEHDGRSRSTHRAFLFYADRGIEGPAGWRKMEVEPDSPMAIYCAMPGRRDDPSHIIDQAGQELVAATEAIADYEKQIEDAFSETRGARFYVPVLATTARLHTYAVPPDSLSLQTGTANPASVTGAPIPFIRMTKAFTAPRYTGTARSLRELGTNEERTLFVVEAQHFVQFLERFSIIGASLMYMMV